MDQKSLNMPFYTKGLPVLLQPLCRPSNGRLVVWEPAVLRCAGGAMPDQEVYNYFEHDTLNAHIVLSPKSGAEARDDVLHAGYNLQLRRIFGAECLRGARMNGVALLKSVLAGFAQDDLANTLVVRHADSGFFAYAGTLGVQSVVVGGDGLPNMASVFKDILGAGRGCQKRIWCRTELYDGGRIRGPL